MIIGIQYAGQPTVKGFDCDKTKLIAHRQISNYNDDDKIQ